MLQELDEGITDSFCEFVLTNIFIKDLIKGESFSYLLGVLGNDNGMFFHVKMNIGFFLIHEDWFQTTTDTDWVGSHNTMSLKGRLYKVVILAQIKLFLMNCLVHNKVLNLNIIKSQIATQI